MERYRLINGTPHPVAFSNGVVLERNPNFNPPRAQTSERLSNRQYTNVEFAGTHFSVPVFEVSFGKLERVQELRHEIGEIATGLVIMSRIAERSARLSGIKGGFAHPARMWRGAERNSILAADLAAVPQPAIPLGDASEVAKARDFNGVNQLINLYPEGLTLTSSQANLPLPSYGSIQPNYGYQTIGYSEEGIEVAASIIHNVSAPFDISEYDIVIAHPEAIVESIRCGVDPEICAKMVFPHHVERNGSGQQSNVCSSFGYFSERTLDAFLQEAQI